MSWKGKFIPTSPKVDKRPRTDDDDNENPDTDDSDEFDNELKQRRTQNSPEQLNQTIQTQHAFALKQLGACVILDPFFVSNADSLVEQFDEALRGFPEYRKDMGEPDYVLGGFSALANPSSWHNPFTRYIRLHAMTAVYPVFQRLASVSTQMGQGDFKLAQIADRMMYRKPNVKPDADTWHRDIKKNQIDGETIYGGWINTSTNTQYLSCVLGTHTDEPEDGDEEGFAKITDRELIKVYEIEKTKVEVPPGGILIFNERMVHEVLAEPKPYAIRRIFLAWMTTPVQNDHFPANIRQLLQNQAPITVKSGQNPKLFPSTYYMYFIDRLTAWSVKTFVPNMLIDKVQPPTAKKLAGQTIKVVPQVSWSLGDLGLPMYMDYRDYEVAVFFANDSHMLPEQAGSDNIVLKTLR